MWGEGPEMPCWSDANVGPRELARVQPLCIEGGHALKKMRVDSYISEGGLCEIEAFLPIICFPFLVIDWRRFPELPLVLSDKRRDARRSTITGLQIRCYVLLVFEIDSCKRSTMRFSWTVIHHPFRMKIMGCSYCWWFIGRRGLEVEKGSWRGPGVSQTLGQYLIPPVDALRRLFLRSNRCRRDPIWQGIKSA